MNSGDEYYGDEITSPLYRPFTHDTELSLFDQWMTELDRIVTEASGISIHDLPDLQFRDAFDDDQEPVDFAAEVFGIWDGEIKRLDLFRDATT